MVQLACENPLLEEAGLDYNPVPTLWETGLSLTIVPFRQHLYVL